MTKLAAKSIYVLLCATRDDADTLTGFGAQEYQSEEPFYLPKDKAVELVKGGADLHPVWVDEDGRPHLGLKCHVNGDHIEADPNDQICDNLGELPDCDLTSFYTK